MSEIKKTNTQGKKRRYYPPKKKRTEPTVSGPKIQPKSYVPSTKQPKTFTELQYTDKVIYVIGGVTLVMSLVMWFMGHREEATYMGIWVPGIFSAGTFIRFSLTRARRK